MTTSGLLLAGIQCSLWSVGDPGGLFAQFHGNQWMFVVQKGYWAQPHQRPISSSHLSCGARVGIFWAFKFVECLPDSLPNVKTHTIAWKVTFLGYKRGEIFHLYVQTDLYVQVCAWCISGQVVCICAWVCTCRRVCASADALGAETSTT